MKILTNLNCLTPPLTGIGQYARNLTLRLKKYPEIVQLKAYYRNRWLKNSQLDIFLECLDAPTTSSRLDVKNILRSQLRKLPGSYRLRHALQSSAFRNATAGYNDYVYWEPGLALQPFDGRCVATVYDLSHVTVPQYHPAQRVAFLNHELERTFNTADHIITISKMMRDEIVAYTGLPLENLTVIPPAADTSFRVLSEESKEHTRIRLGLPQRYILMVGTLEPRKNISRIITAYQHLPDSLRQRWPLVSVGAKGWNDKGLSRDARQLLRKGQLIPLGYVPQSDLPLITASAGLVAYLSIYEGFGMPIVEALACGVPVLTSRSTSMHEITGDSAFLANPLDVDDIASGLSRALEDEARRSILSHQGPAIAASYDWEVSAKRLAKALNGS